MLFHRLLGLRDRVICTFHVPDGVLVRTWDLLNGLLGAQFDSLKISRELAKLFEVNLECWGALSVMWSYDLWHLILHKVFGVLVSLILQAQGCASHILLLDALHWTNSCFFLCQLVDCFVILDHLLVSLTLDLANLLRLDLADVADL